MIAITTDLRDLLVPLVLAGAGATLVPDRVALDAAAQGAVIATVEPSVRREVGLIVRDGAPSAVLETFLTHATTCHRSAG